MPKRRTNRGGRPLVPAELWPEGLLAGRAGSLGAPRARARSGCVLPEVTPGSSQRGVSGAPAAHRGRRER